MRDLVRSIVYWVAMIGASAWGIFHLAYGDAITAAICAGFVYQLWKREEDNE